MTTVLQYVTTMRNAEERIAGLLGCDLSRNSKDRRVEQVAPLAMLAVLVKVLVDKGYVTDAELQAAFTDAIAQVWPEEEAGG